MKSIKIGRILFIAVIHHSMLFYKAFANSQRLEQLLTLELKRLGYHHLHPETFIGIGFVDAGHESFGPVLEIWLSSSTLSDLAFEWGR